MVPEWTGRNDKATVNVEVLAGMPGLTPRADGRREEEEEEAG